jgi:hypothetical protein
VSEVLVVPDGVRVERISSCGTSTGRRGKC